MEERCLRESDTYGNELDKQALAPCIFSFDHQGRSIKQNFWNFPGVCFGKQFILKFFPFVWSTQQFLLDLNYRPNYFHNRISYSFFRVRSAADAGCPFAKVVRKLGKVASLAESRQLWKLCPYTWDLPENWVLLLINMWQMLPNNAAP